ncbi:Chemotaxis protein [Desulfonema limicola]|uniref:Chemotaxis protein n=1 Tax=Desulfonema limicola TaxID=45656 RepID=A0A975BAH1_9BACT|nr:response regulator [Desulfonema limicola]QTA81692.1 Chemotaxis protein [Desulfonema limicola]
MKNIRVLLVDDFSTMRRVIKKILKGMGLENVMEADNGMEAWNLINKQNFDLVICDWHMPKMKGLDLLEKIRASTDYADLPFIMVSAEGKKDSILQATEKGVTNYITKPFSADDLEKILKSMLIG